MRTTKANDKPRRATAPASPGIPGLYISGTLAGLRPIEEADAERCYAWFNDWEILRFVSAWAPKTLAAERAWTARDRTALTDFTFAVIRLTDSAHVGNGGLHSVDWQSRTATMGLVIGDRSAQDAGLGREVEALLLRYAFRQLNLHRVQASVYSLNPRSRHVAALIGMRHEGTRRERVYRDGRYYDEELFGILRAEWEELETAGRTIA